MSKRNKLAAAFMSLCLFAPSSFHATGVKQQNVQKEVTWPKTCKDIGGISGIVATVSFAAALISQAKRGSTFVGGIMANIGLDRGTNFEMAAMGVGGVASLLGGILATTGFIANKAANGHFFN